MITHYVIDTSILAQGFMEDAETPRMDTIMNRAMDIAIDHQLAVYDCVNIALAENVGYSLITVDKKQALVAAAVGISLKPITDFPEFVEPEA